MRRISTIIGCTICLLALLSVQSFESEYLVASKLRQITVDGWLQITSQYYRDTDKPYWVMAKRGQAVIVPHGNALLPGICYRNISDRPRKPVTTINYWCKTDDASLYFRHPQTGTHLRTVGLHVAGTMVPGSFKFPVTPTIKTAKGNISCSIDDDMYIKVPKNAKSGTVYTVYATVNGAEGRIFLYTFPAIAKIQVE